MPRKSNQTQVTMTAIDEALNTPVNLQFCEVAEELRIGEAELRERLEGKLNNSEVHLWDTIPIRPLAKVAAGVL
jgi:predicted ArsR family transcriptional regulator